MVIQKSSGDKRNLPITKPPFLVGFQFALSGAQKWRLWASISLFLFGHLNPWGTFKVVSAQAMYLQPMPSESLRVYFYFSFSKLLSDSSVQPRVGNNVLG